MGTSSSLMSNKYNRYELIFNKAIILNDKTIGNTSSQK